VSAIAASPRVYAQGSAGGFTREREGAGGREGKTGGYGDSHSSHTPLSSHNSGLTTPRTNDVVSSSVRSARTARSARGGMLAMKVLPPSRKNEENERLRTLEQDSERWFQEQQRREANGELGKCF